MLPKTLPGRIGLAVTVLLLVVGAGVLGWSVFGERGREAVGAATVGGPFELTDHTGETRTAEDFRGRYTLVYFGFTFCPDVCPTGLATMSRALESLAERAPKKAEAVVPIFITVDPERDDVEAMGAYVSHFHDRMVGLTGTPEQIAAAAKEYRVYYRKVEDEESGSYLMDHSSFIFLMGPEGEYLTHFTHETPVEELAAGLAERVEP